MATAYSGLKLPFQFDIARLRHDLHLIGSEEWSPHYNDLDFGGEWSGVALRSAAGRAQDLHAGNAGESTWADTKLLGRCDYFRKVLGEFECPLKSVRLLSLAAGSFIREHSDHALDFEEGEVRIHIPIETNPGVEFYVSGVRLLMEEGGCYYVNVNLPHRVNNRGQTPRVHLVIDASVNDWVRRLFAASGEIPRALAPGGGFEEFARIVFSDKDLLARLRGIAGNKELLRTILREAADRGFDLNEADVEAASREWPAEIPSPVTPGWLPTKIFFRESQPWANWVYASGRRFTEPFFEDTVRALTYEPFGRLFQRDMPLRQIPQVQPDGLIFHLSRCGSTLVSRSLAQAESVLVLSEPPPLDAILHTGLHTGIHTGNIDLLRDVVSALANARSASETGYVIKVDSWHIASLALFRAAFPQTPWIFVYRDPREVLASQLRRPGMHASAGAMDPAILGMRFEDITGLTRPQWCIRVLENFLAAALRYRDDAKGLFIDYRELPDAIHGKIIPHFGLRLSPEDEARVLAATTADAKNPGMVFEADGAEKRREIEPILASADLGRLDALYAELTQRQTGL